MEEKSFLDNFFVICLAAIILTGIFIPRQVWAVRPFITDDARITDKASLLWETSIRVDKERLQNLNVLSYGLAKRVEVSLNFTDGMMINDETRGNPSIAGPGLQVKYLFGDGVGIDFPSTALVVGATSPNGMGSATFKAPDWSEYAYLAITKALVNHPENLNMHINLGINHSEVEGHPTTASWGIGFQIHMVEKTFLCTEVFAGDPYAITPGAIYQVGLRFFVNDKMQIDASAGHGLWGEPALRGFLGFGLRMVFD
ncbi:MAG: hypothetical protein PHN75_17350 [Syntrophales bacterium]|nr:hypothetical protein [Syntrophales bacterium]